MKNFREKINEIDKKLLKLLEDRLILSYKIGALKKIENLPIENLKREEEILNSFNGEIFSPYVKEIYKKIFDLSKDLQKIAHSLLETNIVLIGMPGSGKTSVGRVLAKLMKRTFIDLDEEFEKIYGSPEDYIINFGEEKFRDLETELARKFLRTKYSVIATGGGIVTREENFEILRENSLVYFLDRDTEKLKVLGRPLDYKKDLKKLREKRISAYEKFAHASIENNGEIFLAAKNIKEDFENRILVKLEDRVLLY
ncbi:shikimate kinase [Peptoniphilus raoultii]|uniref:shikimate kinase n=1 Tax=Peptoniphilus raoultii TaxID=1776387 RepID=UPI0008D996A2|nr:shikimate kinase [Peptoniphilus raoultii]